jgi:4-amino-4-deoxy-L-arabinose transferase-like glycosyltransferase
MMLHMTGTPTPSGVRSDGGVGGRAGLGDSLVKAGYGRARACYRSATGPPQARFWLGVACLLLVALTLRVVYVLSTHGFAPIQVDPRAYDHLGRMLVEGHGWGFGNSAYRPPGYPVFLAGVYLLIGIPHGVFTAPRLIEAGVATVTVALIGLMTWQLAGRVAALIALAIAAVYVPLAIVGVSFMSESLFVPLVLVASNCAVRSRAATHRYRWIALAGLFTGFGALTRGNGIVLGLALALVVWTRRPRLSWRSLLAPLILLVIMCLTTAPWTIRNAYAQHAFIPVTDELGFTLKGTYNDLSAKHRFIWRPGVQANYQAVVYDKHLTESQRNTRLTGAVIHYIYEHPLDLPEAVFWNTMRLLDLQGRKLSRMTARNDEEASAAVADIGVVSFWIVGALAIVGAFTVGARRSPRSVWIIPLILWASVAPVTTGTPRFRAAIDPWVIVLAAFGVQAVGAALLRRPARSRPLRRLSVSG